MNLDPVHVQKIMVPLDGSSASEAALPWALELAAKHQAQMVLLRVGRAPDIFDGQDIHGLLAFEKAEEDRCRQYLQQVKARLKADAFVQVSVDYASGRAGRAITARAAELGVSVIVMNSHGRDGLNRWWMGSVAEKVTRHAPCPVLLVRQSPAGEVNQGKGEAHATVSA